MGSILALKVETMETIIHMQPVIEIDDERFYALCQLNRDVRLERNQEGNVIIMPPTGGDTGRRNAEIIVQLGMWARQDETGTIFDSSTGFRLPNNAVRSPDAAWVENARLDLLSDEERRTFVPLCPEFLLELRSESDDLGTLKEKMREYIDNGTRLAWLIDPLERKVSIYRSGLPVEVLENPKYISGDPILSGFTLDLRTIW